MKFLTAETKKKISETLKRKGIEPKKKYIGPAWNKGLKGKEYLDHYKHGSVWNKDKVGLQQSTKKGKKFEDLYGEDKSRKVKGLIKEKRARQIFPLKDTSIEVKIQTLLKQLQIEFYTHQYIKEIEHGYQCDIFIPIQNGINKPTILECFGTYWHRYPLGRDIDTQRCRELRNKGFRVIVLWENEIKLIKKDELKEVLQCPQS